MNRCYADKSIRCRLVRFTKAVAESLATGKPLKNTRCASSGLVLEQSTSWGRFVNTQLVIQEATKWHTDSHQHAV